MRFQDSLQFCILVDQMLSQAHEMITMKVIISIRMLYLQIWRREFLANSSRCCLEGNLNQTIQTKTASPRLHPCEYKTTTKLLLANVEEWPQEWQLEVQVPKHPANDSHILFVMLFAQQQLNHLCKQGLLVFIKHLHVVWKLVEHFFVHGTQQGPHPIS